MHIKLKPSIACKRLSRMTPEACVELDRALSTISKSYRATLKKRGIKDPRHITTKSILALHNDRFDKNGKLTQNGQAWLSLAVLSLKKGFKKGLKLDIDKITIGDYVKAYMKFEKGLNSKAKKGRNLVRIVDKLGSSRKKGLSMEVFAGLISRFKRRIKPQKTK